jgi:hypothetical protein
MEGTRKHLFRDIYTWLEDVHDSNVLWLTGIPGAGKSAVASSIVSRLIKDGRFGSHFFFKQDDASLNNSTALWRTVSYDLAKCNPAFADAVAATLQEGKINLQWPNIELHFTSLIEEPLRKIYHDSISPVIVIDALDECDADLAHAGQRRALLKTLVQWTRLPKKFKLIITGRDDRIPDSFRTACKIIVLPTGGGVNTDANNDIRQFFEERFAELVGSSIAWPGEQIIRDLTTRAAGLFIWAETIMRSLEQDLSEEQLELLLSGDYGEEDNLTNLYRKILNSAFRGAKKRTLEIYKIVISTLVLAKVPFRYDDLPKFLAQQQISIKPILDKLSSIVSVGADKRLRISHLSFTEFLCDPHRCPEEFFIDRGKESERIAMACFERMKEGLKFNICDLETSYLRNDKVENISERIAEKISGPLSYSCRFWTIHLLDAANGHDRLAQEVEELLNHRFLYWLEVMSFLKEVLQGNATLLTVVP